MNNKMSLIMIKIYEILGFIVSNHNLYKQVRFSKPVLPGQTLRTSTWNEGGKIVFQTTVVETGETCLAGGWVEMKNLQSKL